MVTPRPEIEIPPRPGRPPEQEVTAPSPASNGNSPDHPPPVLEIESLSKHFGRLRAVDEISFQARPGQVMGFIGPNGAGKTSAMRILATLDVPTSGDAFICGYSVIDDPDQARRLLGFMPDSFGRYTNMNVVEYLDFFARAYGFRGGARREAVERVLVFTELRKIADKKVTTLSKGMSQRLGLGRTLIHDPRVLILDEPAAGLDPRARVELRELIRLLSTTLGKTVLISSHILTELGEICDSAAIIEAGRILAAGTVEELQAMPGSSGAKHPAITIRLLHPAPEMERWLLQRPHVHAVLAARTAVTVEFDGNEQARGRLLGDLVEAGFPVTDFSSKSESLEDAFMNITEGIVQ